MPDANTIAIENLKVDAKNVREHPQKNADAISGSLKRFGPARSIVIDGNDMVRAGNGTLKEAIKAGVKKVQVVDVDGETLVAVRRKDWSDSEATAYAITDNRTGELAEWSFESLADELKSLTDQEFDLGELGWDQNDLEPLLEANWSPPQVGVLPTIPVKSSSEPIDLNDEQRAAVDKAIELARNGDAELSDGQCLKIVCDQYTYGE